MAKKVGTGLERRKVLFESLPKRGEKSWLQGNGITRTWQVTTMMEGIYPRNDACPLVLSQPLLLHLVKRLILTVARLKLLGLNHASHFGDRFLPSLAPSGRAFRIFLPYLKISLGASEAAYDFQP
jgi:hypothetical protein